MPLLADRGLIAAGPLPAELFALGVTWLVMLPAALWVTAVSEGRAAAQGVLRRLLHWRLGLGWWLMVVLALPLTTLAVGVALGGSVGVGSASILVRGTLLLPPPSCSSTCGRRRCWRASSRPGWNGDTAGSWRPCSPRSRSRRSTYP